MAKLDNKTFLVCCANGAGTSLMMKMTLQKVLDKLNVELIRKIVYLFVGLSGILTVLQNL